MADDRDVPDTPTGWVSPGPAFPEPPTTAPAPGKPYAGNVPPPGQPRLPYRPALPSQSKAGWALGLSFVFCCPVLPVVAIVLAVQVLRARRSDGLDHGSGLAIGAIVVGAGSLLAAAGVIAIGVVYDDPLEQPDRDASGQVQDSEEISPFVLRTGDCGNDPALAGLERADEEIFTERLDVVPCTEPHDFEVAVTFDLEQREFPGRSAVVSEARRGCSRRLLDVLPRRTYRLAEFAYFYPTRQSWETLDDRSVICLVLDGRGEKLRAAVPRR